MKLALHFGQGRTAISVSLGLPVRPVMNVRCALLASNARRAHHVFLVRIAKSARSDLRAMTASDVVCVFGVRIATSAVIGSAERIAKTAVPVFLG